MQKFIINKKNFLLILLISILMCIYLFINSEKSLVYLGEKVFLTYHNNSLAIKILNKTDLEKNYKANFLLGRLHFVEGNLNTSIENYNNSIAIISDSLTADAAAQAPKGAVLQQSYYGRGLTYGFMGDIFLTNAEKDFQKYIEIEENKSEKDRSYGAWAGYNDLAWIQYLLGNFQESEQTILKALKFSSENPWLLNMLGILQIEKKDFKNAKTNLEKAKNILEKIDANNWGEAYSGDSFSKYKKGKENMLKSIQENIKLAQDSMGK